MRIASETGERTACGPADRRPEHCRAAPARRGSQAKRDGARGRCTCPAELLARTAAGLVTTRHLAVTGDRRGLGEAASEQARPRVRSQQGETMNFLKTVTLAASAAVLAAGGVAAQG